MPREFWIVGLRDGCVGCSAVVDKKHLHKYAKESEEDTIHVIEYSALQALIDENESLKTANLRAVEAAYHALLQATAWMGIPQSKRTAHIEEAMSNVRFCANVENQKPLRDQAFQEVINENAKLVEKLKKAEDVIRKMMLRLEVIETFKCHNTLGKSRCNIENTQSIKAARAYLKEQGE